MYGDRPVHQDDSWSSSHQDRFEHHRLYTVRVRSATTYLWGSSGIKSNASFASPLILHIHNEVAGEPVTFGTETSDGAQTTIGTLQPGQSFSVSINDVRGVFATCTVVESNVSCSIKDS
jgi:hypothetical protein